MTLRYYWNALNDKAVHPNVLVMKNSGLINLFTKIRGEFVIDDT